MLIPFPFIRTPEKKILLRVFHHHDDVIHFTARNERRRFPATFFPKSRQVKAIEDSQLEKIKALYRMCLLTFPHKEIILTGKLSQLIHTLLHAEEKRTLYSFSNKQTIDR